MIEWDAMTCCESKKILIRISVNSSPRLRVSGTTRWRYAAEHLQNLAAKFTIAGESAQGRFNKNILTSAGWCDRKETGISMWAMNK